ncbi:peroxiredoxin [Calditrichota bacterium]
MVQVGKKMPDFELDAVSPEGNFIKVKLSDYRGKWLMLFFYPLDFTFVCPTEITGFSDNYDNFKKLNAEVLGASVDSKNSHRAWIDSSLGKINFPLASDMAHTLSAELGILMEDKCYTLRGSYIIDPEGVLRWEVVHDTDVGRSVEETLRVLEAFQTGKLCPVNWRHGEKTLD